MSVVENSVRAASAFSNGTLLSSSKGDGVLYVSWFNTRNNVANGSVFSVDFRFPRRQMPIPMKFQSYRLRPIPLTKKNALWQFPQKMSGSPCWIQSQIQFVGQTVIGEGNSYGFSFIPSEDPSIDTGDYVVSLAVEGASGLINIATIEAPKQQYRVSFLGLNQQPLCDTIFVNEGSNVEYPAAPACAGYRFAGWDAPVTSINRDITINARYLPEEYVVVLADHINQTVSLQRLNAVTESGAPAEFTLPTDLVSEGYIFKGWTIDGNPVEGTTITITGDTVLEASWEPKMFRVQFLDQNGAVLDEQLVAYGKSATPPAAIEAENMHFLGWSTDVCWWNVTGDLVTETDAEINSAQSSDAQSSHAVSPLMAYLLNADTPTSNLGDLAMGQEKILELTAEDGAKIYYTVDGSDPSPDGDVNKTERSGEDAIEVPIGSGTYEYNGPLSLTDDTEIKAIGVKDGKNDSEILEFTFYYSEDVIDDELDGQSVTISESEIMTAPGDTIPLTVRIDNNPGIMAYVMQIECDRKVFYVERVDNGDLVYDCAPGGSFKNGSLLVAPCESGYQIFWYNTAQSTADDILFTLNLKVSEEADRATRKIRLSYYPDNTVTGDLSPIPLDDNLEAMFGSDTSVLGDVNGDGRITAADVVLIARYVINDVSFTVDQQNLADVTNDGRITAADVIRLSRYIVGLATLG